tara:strand:- start:5364 stop:6035 length:672 start_codon:yes stop_codon:yes gene_type:complete
MPRPTTYPKIDANGTNVSTPLTQIQDDGLPEKSLFANGIWNWAFHWIYQWIVWLNGSTTVKTAKSSTNVNNTAVETEFNIGRLAFAANELEEGDVVQARYLFYLSGYSSGTVLWQLRFGDSTDAVTDRAIAAGLQAANPDNSGRQYIVDLDLQVLSVGAAGQLRGTATWRSTESTQESVIQYKLLTGFDTTVATTLSGTIDFQTAAVGNAAELWNARVEQLRA